MKKLLLLSFCLASFLGKAQVTIVEETMENANKEVRYQLLPNSNVMVITKGKPMGGLVAADFINNITSYDIDANKKVLSSDKKLYTTVFSNSENAILTADISSGIFKAKMKYLIDGKLIDSDFNDRRSVQYISDAFFTSKHAFGLKNQKGKYDIDFQKDEIILVVTNILNRKDGIFKIEKPNLDRLIGSNFIKTEEALGFKLMVNYDETIDFVTKSISKDYTKTILYKTRFSNEGNKVNELIYDLKVPNHVFLYSRNYGGKFISGGYGGKFLHFGDDLSINNYFEDTKNGDIYIYGLYGDELGKLNDMASPKGYYIFKFDKSGNKIWESINNIDESDFNKSHVMSTVFVDLVQLNNNLCFTIRVNGLKDFFSYNIIDKDSGKITKSQNLNFNETFAHLDDTEYNRFSINSDFKNLKEFKDKKFNFNSIIAINLNPKFAEYIKNAKSKNDLYFASNFTDKGIWLTETDKDHYKVTLFKD